MMPIIVIYIKNMLWGMRDDVEKSGNVANARVVFSACCNFSVFYCFF